MAWRSWTWTGVLDGVVAELVGRAVGDARLDAAAGQPDRKAVDVVVAAVALGHRRAAEFAAPDHQRVVEHAALLEVLDQRGRGLVDLLGHAGDLVFDAAVMVPVAVIKLDEAHAALGQPPGQQAVGGEGAVGPLACRTCPAVSPASSEMSISSGTLLCMRKAISYWLIRVAISGIVHHRVVQSIQLVDRIDHVAAVRAASIPGGLPTYSTGSPLHRKRTP